MKPLQDARADARARRLELTKSLEVLRQRLTPRELAGDALTIFDGTVAFLGRPQTVINRHPLIIAGVLGAAWLFNEASRTRNKPAERRKPGRPRSGKTTNVTFNRKGDPL